MESRRIALILGLLALITAAGTATSSPFDGGNLTVQHPANVSCDGGCNISVQVNNTGLNGTVFNYSATGTSYTGTEDAVLFFEDSRVGPGPDWDLAASFGSSFSGLDESNTDQGWNLTLSLSNVSSYGKYEFNQSIDWNESASSNGSVSFAVNVTLENEAPRLSLVSPTDDPAYLNGSEVFNLSVTDANPVNVTMAATYFNGTSYNLSGTTGQTDVRFNGSHATETLTVSGFEDGNYTFNATANDSLGALNYLERDLVIDTTAPTIWNLTLNATGNQTDPYSGPLNLTGTVNETLYSGGKTRCSLDLDGDRGSQTATVNITGDGLDHWFSQNLSASGIEGNTTLSVACTDPAGNTGTNSSFHIGGTSSGNLTQSIWLDNAGPEIVDVTPDNATYQDDVNQTITATLDDLSNISYANITMNENKFTNASSRFNVTTSDGQTDIRLQTSNLDEDVQQDLTLWTNDSLGQLTTYDWQFTTDFTTPEITLTNITGTRKAGWWKDSVTFEYTCTDPNGNLANRTITRDSTLIDHNATSGALKVTDDAEVEGTFTYNLTCTDRAGNVNWTNTTEQLDNKDPVMTVNSPDETEATESTDYTIDIDLELTDGGSGFNASLYEDEDNWEDEISNDFTIDTVDVGSDNQTMDIEGSFTFEEYTNENFHIEVMDQVGNGLETDDFDFDLEEPEDTQQNNGGNNNGGGNGGLGGLPQTLSEYEISIDGLPDSIEFRPGETVSEEFSVENIEDGGTVEFSLDLPAGLTGSAPDATFLLTGDTVDQTLDVTADDGFSGGDIELTATLEDATVSRTIDAELAQDPPALDIGLANSSIEVDQGQSYNMTVTITNTGDLTARNVSVGLNRSGLLTTAFTPASANITGGASQRFTGVLSTSGLDIGVHDVIVTASAAGPSATRSIALKVQPSSDAEAAAVQSRIAALEEAARSANVSSDVLQQLQTAQQAAESGDYARAAELADQAADDIPEQDLIEELPLPSLQEVGTVLGIIALLGVLGVGAVLYRDQGGYSGGGGPGRYLDGEGKSMTQRLKEGRQKVSYRAKEKIEGQGTDQKRVSFNDED